MLSKCKKIIYSLTTFGVIYKHIVTIATFNNSLQNVLLLLNQLFFAERCLLLKHAKFWKMLILHTFSPDTLGRSINFLNSLSTQLAWQFALLWTMKQRLKLNSTVSIQTDHRLENFIYQKIKNQFLFTEVQQIVFTT